ncbi:hypothetical protein HPB51_011099 [Rhipicephalus microplus]|uniref:Rhoa gtpase effector dia/diaphanous n=1 Tax=Rhipicephalus microplus TaxID=6941 RepID=A0A9J6DVL9_RHIMP|nr:hypothetical protein HPB51_011099 [Rhipicephalus microplus]
MGIRLCSLSGLGFLELVEPLRRSGDDELFIQCHVFETTREADDEHALSLGLTASGNHYDAFAAVMNKVYGKPQSIAFLMLLRNLEKLDPDDTASHLAWELLERLSLQLSSGPVLPLYNAMGPKLTPAPLELAAMERLDNGRHRGGSECDSDVFAECSPPQPKNRLNIFKFITQGFKKGSARGPTGVQVSNLSRSTSFRSKSNQSRRSSQPSPVVRRSQELIGVERSKSTSVKKHSIEGSLQRSSSRSTQLTRSSVHQSSTDGQPPAVPTVCKTSPEVLGRPGLNGTGRLLPLSSSEPQGPKGAQASPVNGGATSVRRRSPTATSAKCDVLHFAPMPYPDNSASPSFRDGGMPDALKRARMQNPQGDGLETEITPSKATQLQAAPRGSASPGPFHTLPKPQQKMKTLNWTKVPDTLVCGGKSIWSDVTKEAQEEHVERKLNFKQLEELFCQKTATTAQPKVPPDKKKKREPALLSMLRSYTGDRSKLGQAEQFFLMLGDLPLYALYVDGMLQMEEFRPSVDALKPQLDNYIGVCQEILTNRSLKEFLKLILITGNFINSGSYAGNAFGFRLNTLPKLLETRSNKPRMTLLHFLVEIAEKEQAQTLSFTKDLRHLAQCSRLSLDGMRAELKQLSTGIEKLERHLPQGDAAFKQHFGAFITAAKAQLSELSSSFEQIGQLSRRLAEHFCEEESRFSVEECLHIFNNFCEKVKLAQKASRSVLQENEERRQLEERAEKLKITRMGTDQSKPGYAKKPAASFVEEECIVDRLLAEIRRGSFKLRKTPA